MATAAWMTGGAGPFLSMALAVATYLGIGFLLGGIRREDILLLRDIVRLPS